ncbi:hypothetical protein N431DRAFT_555214 [Stipitochalara longipes BDJ]|nr:hypothetical protein N431DRAFT_555214 [Stipitochalara longipes BDJ]
MTSRSSGIPGNAGQQPNQIITPPPAYGGGAPPHYSEDEEDGDEGGQDESLLSAIKITIRCPLTIKGDHNLVAVDTALSANKIAQGVVGALKAMSMSGHGVPMIDEDGRPRPITVTAVAEVTITGSKNVVGEKVRPMIPQPAPKPAQGNREGPRVKREREGSEEAELKRSRLE